MSTGELLTIDPQELIFPFELKKQITYSIQLKNNTKNYVAFKVKTTNPKKYCVRPNTGVVLPHSTCDVTVTMQAVKEAPPDMQCKDKFLLQSAVANAGATAKDITSEMFNKETGNQVEESNLRVYYFPPPSPVREGSDEGSSPRASVSENGNMTATEFTATSHDREQGEPSDKFAEISLSPTMSTRDLLTIDPQALMFPFELKKQISCSMQLKNNTENYVAFKVKTTNPKKYCVRPNTGVVLPHSTCDITVTMQAVREAPPDMQCKDKFLLQSTVANAGATAKDITSEMFNKKTGNQVEESNLRVTYVPLPQPPSPVRKGSDEGSSPRASVSENGIMTATEFTSVSDKKLP